MSDATVLSIDLIVSDPRIRGGRPILAGTSLRVQDVAAHHQIPQVHAGELAVQLPDLACAGSRGAGLLLCAPGRDRRPDRRRRSAHPRSKRPGAWTATSACTSMKAFRLPLPNRCEVGG
ncbi:MAG: DUF433 domain-containing protein [Chloroflexi bacterium]|nr:DUF433 domain-containing protein [Chloroflexota bacterium]